VRSLTNWAQKKGSVLLAVYRKVVMPIELHSRCHCPLFCNWVINQSDMPLEERLHSQVVGCVCCRLVGGCRTGNKPCSETLVKTVATRSKILVGNRELVPNIVMATASSA